MKRSVLLIIATLFLFLLATPVSCFADSTVIGELEELLQGVNAPGSKLAGTPLGYAAADAVRASAGTDFAIVNGGDIAHNLFGGAVTRSAVGAVFYEDKPIAVTEITAAELRELLEIAVSTVVVGEGDRVRQEESQNEGFIQPSGFIYQYDASAPVGDRARKVWLDSGEVLDLADDTKKYSLSATADMLGGKYGFPSRAFQLTEHTLVSALTDAVAAGTVTMNGGDRVQMVGTMDQTLFSYIPLGLLIVVGFLFAETNYRRNTRYDYTRYNCRNEEGYEKKRFIRN